MKIISIFSLNQHKHYIYHSLADLSMKAFMDEDFSNHETISRNLSNYLNSYSVQLAMESLIKFIESDIK